MIKKTFLLALVLIMTVASFASVLQAQENEPLASRVSAIQIKGNSSISATTILSRIKMKPGDIFDEGALNKELKRLYAMGYFGDVSVEVEEHTEGIVVIFIVAEKPIIEKVEFRGNTQIKDMRLEEKISVKKGLLLDFHTLSQDVAELKAYYIEQGYSHIKVDYDVKTDPETGEAIVVFVVDEGFSLKIRKITFEGNKNVHDKELKRYMATKKAWWFLQKGVFDGEKFKSDLGRIRSAYRGRGFLDARVTSRIEYSPDGKDLELVIAIDEGQKYLIGEIKITGNLAFPEKEIRKRIKVSPGDPFDYGQIKTDLDDIRAFYYDKGYMNVDIDFRHKYNSAKDKMDITCKIDSRDEVYVGKINIIGNTKTKDKVVRRELRLYPGDKYDGQKLKYSKERIYNLGFFEDVYLDTGATKKKDVKDLNVTVKESKTGELSFGGGYSSVDAFIGFAQIRQRNFDIMNAPTFTGSGQDFIVRTEVGSSRTTYVVSWVDPWIFDLPYLFGTDIYRQEYDKSGLSGFDYNEKRTGGSLKLGKDLTDRINTRLTYNLEEVELSDVSEDASQDLRSEEGEKLLSRLTWETSYDTRDNKFSPTKGWITGFSLENAGGFIGGDKDFVKGFGYASFYHSIMDKVVLELKGRSGAVENYGDTDFVPIYERFYVGGATTIRGYKQRGVGPRDSKDPNIVIGGDAMIVGNAEVVFPLFQNLIKGAVFYDVGSVMRDYKEIFKTAGFKSGAGVGIHLKTPIGPLKLDWGYPLNENEGDKKEGQFYFSVSHGF